MKMKENQRAHGLRCSVKQTTRADAEKLEACLYGFYNT